MNKYLLIRLGAIGDIVLATAAIEAISQAEPGSQIDLVCKARFAGLLKGHPKLANVHGFDETDRHQGLRGLIMFIHELSANNYNFIIDLQNNPRSRMIALCLNVGKKIHWPKDTWRRRMLVWGRGRGKTYKTVIQRYLAAVEKAGVKQPEAKPKLYPVVDDTIKLPQGEFIAIAPGAHWPTKRWTGYSELITKIGNGKWEIVVVSDKSDRLAVEEIINKSKTSVTNLCGQLDLAQLTYVLSKAKLLVTNDTGAMHIAEAAGTPVVAIFGPTVRQFGFAPWRAESRVIETELDCRPCALHGSRQCPQGHFNCMKLITADQVLAEMKGLV
ncbi:MAG: glycosyltransferase family 9 protein [Candidatus Edwardsbacteria bacterium]|nr:glycosyltransferase family 9 protein [Candidatus Edwardsbacteria bacterium]